MRRAFAPLGLSATFLVAWMALLAPQAVARVEGPCTASIGGEDVTTGHDDPGSAVSLPSGESVPVAGTAQGRVTDLTYTVHVAGAGIQVGTVALSEDGRSWAGRVDLEKISNATVGVFEVTAAVQTDAGDCSGVAFVCIEGRTPFTTAAGAGATAFGVGGGILLALSLVRARGMGVARSALQGFAGGATAGLGGAVLLQQFCTLPLTPASAAGIPASFGAAGAIGASVLRRVGARGARRAARLRTRRPGAGVPSEEPTQVLERGAERVHHVVDHQAGGRELIDAGRGAGGPSASASGGPGGGPSPAPGAPGGPGAAPASPTPGGVVLPPMPPASDDEGSCPNCGAENSPDSQFCTNCGTRLAR